MSKKFNILEVADVSYLGRTTHISATELFVPDASGFHRFTCVVTLNNPSDPSANLFVAAQYTDQSGFVDFDAGQALFVASPPPDPSYNHPLPVQSVIYLIEGHAVSFLTGADGLAGGPISKFDSFNLWLTAERL